MNVVDVLRLRPGRKYGAFESKRAAAEQIDGAIVQAQRFVARIDVLRIDEDAVLRKQAPAAREHGDARRRLPGAPHAGDDESATIELEARGRERLESAKVLQIPRQRLIHEPAGQYVELALAMVRFVRPLLATRGVRIRRLDVQTVRGQAEAKGQILDACRVRPHEPVVIGPMALAEARQLRSIEERAGCVPGAVTLEPMHLDCDVCLGRRPSAHVRRLLAVRSLDVMG